VEGECERLLGELALDAGDLEAAQARFTRALAISRDAGDKRNEAIGLWYMGRAELACGVFDVAEERLSSALAVFQSFRMNAEAIGCLEDYATLLRVRGDVEGAVSLSATLESARRMLALPRRPRAEPGWDGERLSSRAAMGDQAYDAAWARGSERLLEDAIEQLLTVVEAEPAVAA
jgi:tetratricopeptide (TPR) repeat protein